LLILYTKHVSP